MRRVTIFRLLGTVLVIGIGVYSAFWWIAAGRIKDAATAWQSTAQAQKLDVTWQSLRVAGYPFSFRLELGDAALKSEATTPAVTLHAPTLTAGAHPWSPRDLRFDAPDGLTLTLGPDALPLARLSAAHGSGALSLAADGTATVWLSLAEAKVSAGLILGTQRVNGWAILPQAASGLPPRSGFAVALDARDLALPVAPPGFNPTVDDLAFGLTLTGGFPPGPPRQAATAWRNAGGTVDLDHLHLRWGDMAITGSGTLALDDDLQPVGGFSGGVSGFDQLLSALVATGRIKASDARVARLALAMLAKTGADGRPEISTSLTIQNGQMYLGPAKLGPAPRIDW